MRALSARRPSFPPRGRGVVGLQDSRSRAFEQLGAGLSPGQGVNRPPARDAVRTRLLAVAPGAPGQGASLACTHRCGRAAAALGSASLGSRGFNFL